MNQHDRITYNLADDAARRMTDEELIAAHIEYMRQDGIILAGGETRRGLIDDPYWTYIKYVARERGVDLHGAYTASLR